MRSDQIRSDRIRSGGIRWACACVEEDSWSCSRCCWSEVEVQTRVVEVVKELPDGESSRPIEAAYLWTRRVCKRGGCAREGVHESTRGCGRVHERVWTRAQEGVKECAREGVEECGVKECGVKELRAVG
jgi:hypothetical protein